ncbi:hypothetical protein KUH03_22535 [Sphingobacterium sp. E70]|uniref:hypothetical protein n=1 Tax=Sphingobacterium sp. E70 TaxID=2853439 RepID=UPI00211C13C3|nr:hypothetical protein [Sphingobacterium sp. E70]ULT22240.1 hypothetical protein KUH03_22535 [Sphingobacterium sp. E70]
MISKEVIFSIAYDYTTAKFEPSWTGEFYHFKQREIYGGGRNGNDGIVLIPGYSANMRTLICVKTMVLGRSNG